MLSLNLTSCSNTSNSSSEPVVILDDDFLVSSDESDDGFESALEGLDDEDSEDSDFSNLSDESSVETQEVLTESESDAISDDELDMDDFDDLKVSETPSISTESEFSDEELDLDASFTEDTGEDLFDDFSEASTEEEFDDFDESLDSEFEVLQAESKIEPPAATQVLGSTNVVERFGYDPNVSGGAVFIQTRNKPRIQTNYNPQSRQFVVSLAQTQLPKMFQRPLYMKDFNQSFGAVNPYLSPGDNSPNFVIQVAKGGVPRVETQGNTVWVYPSEKIDKSENNKFIAKKTLNSGNLQEFILGEHKFYGKPINLEVDNESIRTIIRLIAQKSGANIVMTDGVKGNLSIKLRQTPWDEALITVMKSKGLGYVRSGNVLRIASLEEIKKESESVLAVNEARKGVEPLKSSLIPLSYALPGDLKTKLQPLLSKRGKIIEDNRTTSLIVMDTQDVLDRITSVVRELDVAPSQVLIEGRIVEATKDFKRTLGIKWGFFGGSTVLSQTGGVAGSSIIASPNILINNASPNVNLSGGTGAATLQPFTASLQLGTLDILGTLTSLINIGESENRLKVLSSPRIMTMNNVQASISQTSEVLQPKIAIEDGQVVNSVERIPVKLDLVVTPQITADAKVILDLELNREFAGAFNTIVNTAPKNSRSAKTKVLVRNNETTVIGGIYQTDSTRFESGIPVLRKIPIIGWLFKERNRTKLETELLIFLTPRIVNPNQRAARVIQ